MGTDSGLIPTGRMILVTGAGGKTGRTLIKALSKTESVCAFVRGEEHVSAVKTLGVEKVEVGDMRDETAIRSAMIDVRIVYHICPNMSPDEITIGKLVIEGARKASVVHFVYHSVLHPQTEKMKHHWAKLRVEELLFESGLPFTILQPTAYMQNLLANWDIIINEGVLRVPYSVNKQFSFVDLENVAEAAVIVLTQPNHLNATYELVGTPSISYVEVAKIFSRVLNKSIIAEKEKIEDWKLRVKGMSGYTTENLIRMFDYYDNWGLSGNPNVLGWLLGREPTALETFIQKTITERGAIH